jgi:DNA invertase Pin-like site-specific DNA recombinase
VKIAAYIRVSTDDQNTQLQRDAIKKYCDYHGLTPVFFEEKESGAKKDRPILKDVIDKIKGKNFSRLVVYKLDRFSRSLTDLLSLLTTVKDAGCDFVSISENLDFSTPIGRLQVQLLGAFAEFEREMIRERVLAGQKSAKSRGVKFGPKSRPLDLSTARALLARGQSATDVARAFGLSRSQLYRRLA